MVDNPNVDPSIRGDQPKVKDLRAKFVDIMHEEIGDELGFNFSDMIDKAADRMMDEVAKLNHDPE